MIIFIVMYIVDIWGLVDVISKFNGIVRRSLWYFQYLFQFVFIVCKKIIKIKYYINVCNLF